MAEQVSESQVPVTTELSIVPVTQPVVNAQPKQTPGPAPASLVAADTSSEESQGCKKTSKQKSLSTKRAQTWMSS